jgi:hypothetical protein
VCACRVGEECRTSLLPSGSGRGPLGLEPRTCGLRVWCEGAGQRPAVPLSCAFASQCYSSFPIVSRSITGMRRGQHSARPCHFDRTGSERAAGGAAPSHRLRYGGDQRGWLRRSPARD